MCLLMLRTPHSSLLGIYFIAGSLSAKYHHKALTAGRFFGLPRLAHFVQHKQGLDFDSIHLWTDSTSVLQWIYGSHQRQQMFVAIRVADIPTNTQSHQWNHCPGETIPPMMVRSEFRSATFIATLLGSKDLSS